MTMPPKDPVDALTQVAEKLNALALDWMLTGSVAAFLYGRNRSTVDIDIVLNCDRLPIGPLCDAFAPEYMLDPQMVRDSIPIGMMFNAIPMTGGPKIDLIPLKTEAFERTAFGRREVHDWHGTRLFVISAADLVLSKLRWAKQSQSERQLADVRAIMATGLVNEDDSDFQRWLAQLDLRPTLDASRETRYDA